MKVGGVRMFLFILSGLTGELNGELFDIKLLSGLDFLGAKGFFDIKLLSVFCFPELLNSGNDTE
jgi:hypothetical protein